MSNYEDAREFSLEQAVRQDLRVLKIILKKVWKWDLVKEMELTKVTDALKQSLLAHLSPALLSVVVHVTC